MNTHINMLSEGYEQKRSGRELTLRWMKFGLVLLIGFGCLYGGLKSRNQALAESLKLSEPEIRPLREMERETQQIRERKQHINGQQSLLTQLEKGKYPLNVIGIISESAAPVGKKIQIQEFTFSVIEQKAETTPAANANTKSPEKVNVLTRIVVRGIALDDFAVTRFMSGLRETNVFESAQLISSEEGIMGNQPTRVFHLELTL